jgi:catechol 2,3-dioxygenase-like lactoylglutathione lyase family enzyme
MADRIDAVLDHVAIAVPDWAAAERRWRDLLGAGRSSAGANPVFLSRQLQFANGAKIELLAASDDDPSPDNFVRRFLQRFGSTIHHVTLKVPDLHVALDVLRAGGLSAVDVRDDVDYWKEAFLRPSEVGGLVVQIAQTPFTDDDWAAFTGFTREAPRPDAAALLGPALRHPDIAEAERIWTLLGADVARNNGQLRCTWPDSPLDVVVTAGEPPGPGPLRMRGSGDLPATGDEGPAVVDAT